MQLGPAVAAGLGVALLPDKVKKLPHENVVFRPLSPTVMTESWFLIRSKGTPRGEITFECCPMDAVPKVSSGIAWRAMKTVPVPHDIFLPTQYYAGKASGMFRARISTPISGGTVTVWPLVGGLIGNTKAASEPVVR
jgi:hypothetical protein